VIYNLPMLTGIDLSPSLISRIATACSNVASLKDTVISFPSYYAA
jgi:dihydrodipicolinate synthase/N-acetylneuraminate lyase